MENFEKPTGQKPEDTRLGMEEARELANMQRAELGVNPQKTSLWAKDWEMGETTADDYDRALETIEELKRLAAEEPATEKVLKVLARTKEKARYLVMNALSTGSYAGVDFENKMEDLEDAAGRLRELKKQAKQY